MRHALGLRELEQDAAVIDERRAVVHQQRGSRGERGHEDVPHRPAAGREVEEAIAGPHVTVQPLLLEVLQQRAARTVHDALRYAGRAGRVEHVHRMVERQAHVLDDARGGVRCDEVCQPLGVRDTRRVAVRIEVRHQHDALQIGKLRHDRGELARGSRCACRCTNSRRPRTAPWVFVCPKRSSTPWMPKSGDVDVKIAPRLDGSEHRHERLGHVGHERRDAIAGTDAVRAQRRRDDGDLAPQLAATQATLDAILAPEHQRVRAIVEVVAQQVLREVESAHRGTRRHPASGRRSTSVRSPRSPRTALKSQTRFQNCSGSVIDQRHKAS